MKRTSRSLTSLLLAVLVSCSFVVAACGSGQPSGPAPGFRLEAADGGEVSLADYHGKLVLLDFWATWCAPCRAQAAILEKLYPDYRDRGLQILSIDMEEPAEVVRAFVSKHDFPYPVLIDETGSVSSEFAVVALPTVVLVDADGEVVFHKAGITSEKTLRAQIDRHLPPS